MLDVQQAEVGFQIEDVGREFAAEWRTGELQLVARSPKFLERRAVATGKSSLAPVKLQVQCVVCAPSDLLKNTRMPLRMNECWHGFLSVLVRTKS